MTRKNKRFFRRLRATLIQLFVYLIIAFLATMAICFLLSIPEMIGMLIFG